MESPKIGTITDLKKFFSTPDKPVSTREFMEMWETLTEAEKEDFKRQVIDQQ